MKHNHVTILIAIFVTAFFAFAANTGRQQEPAGNTNYSPINIFYRTIGSRYLNTDNDSLDSAGVDVWGPFMMSKDKNHPKAKWMQLIAPTACLTAGDSLAVEYQVTASSVLADTISADWTEWDTVTTIGKQFAPVLLDSLHGSCLFLRIRDDGTGDGLRLLKHIRVMFEESLEYFTK